MAERAPKKKKAPTPAKPKRTVRAPKAEPAPAFTRGDVKDAVPAPERPVLYVEVDEEIPSIIDRLRSLGLPAVHLVIPKRAVFLESLVNVKLLKREADALGVALTIVSTDSKAQHLAKQLQLPFEKKLPAVLTKEQSAPEAPATPRRLTPEAPVEEEHQLPGTAVTRRMALGDILAKRRAKPASEIRSLDPREPLPQVALVSGGSNKRLFLFFLTLCVAALAVVMAFVLPKATIRLELESRVEEVTDRIVLADADINAAEFAVRDTNFIPTKPVSIEKELTREYATTGIVSSGSNAQGLMTIVNDAGTAQPLIAATRFRSPDGIIYRLQAPVTVPGRSSVAALVVADPTDEGGKLVGDRGNLPAGTKFTLPGLTGSNRSLVYGRNDAAMAGGVTKAAKVLTQADADAARKDLLDALKSVASEELQKELTDRANAGGPPLFLVSSSDLLTFTTMNFSIADGVGVNAQVEKFRATAKVRLNGYAYDRAAIRTVLDRKIAEIIHPDQRIAATDDAGVKIDIVLPRDAREERQGRFKANATLRYRLEYTLSDELEATIKKRILGDSLTEAERFVQSLEQVGESQITTWPFWVRRIPGIVSSVEVVSVSNIDED